MTLEEIAERVEVVLKSSPADETEIVWLESRGGRAEGRRKQLESRMLNERTVLVRVIDRRRVGSHRTGVADVSELQSAVRQAVAQSRSREPLPGLLRLPADDAPLETRAILWDRRLAELDSEGVEALYRPLLGSRAQLRFGWSIAHVAVFNTRGIRRQAAVTAASLEARIGRRPGGGRAAGAGRTLEQLAPETVLERARLRHAAGAGGELPAGPLSIVLSPEAATRLCDILNRVAFSAIAYYHGSSFLREHLDVQVFDRALSLRDDGSDPTGLPFPFDLEGTAKRPVDLIHKGTPKTPALDQRQAAQLGLKPTAHAIGGNDARGMNLFLLPGELDEQELLGTADGGVWIGWLDEVECFEPARVQIRAHGRGVRRIVDGKLAEGLPDVIWEDSLLRAFSNLLGLGVTPVIQVSPDGFLGAISAPALAIPGVSSLQPSD